MAGIFLFVDAKFLFVTGILLFVTGILLFVAGIFLEVAKIFLFFRIFILKQDKRRFFHIMRDFFFGRVELEMFWYTKIG